MNEVMPFYSVETYQETGVAFPIKVFDSKDKVYFQKAFEAFEAVFENEPTAEQMKQLHLFFPWAYELVTHPSILDIIEQVLGPNIIVHSSSIFCKYPNDPSFVSWHQDGFYYDLNKSKLASAWIALSDSNVANGCMQVVPGTHGKKYGHTEKYQENNMLTTGLTVEEVIKESDVVNIELKAGEMSLHHVNIIHGSKANPSNTKRVGFAIRYIAPEVKQKLSHYDVLLARGEDAFQHYNLLNKKPEGSLIECQAKQAAFHANYLKEREKRLG